MNTQKNEILKEQFYNAKQMWFWFIYSKAVQSNIITRQSGSQKRIC